MNEDSLVQPSSTETQAEYVIVFYLNDFCCRNHIWFQPSQEFKATFWMVTQYIISNRLPLVLLLVLAIVMGSAVL